MNWETDIQHRQTDNIYREATHTDRPNKHIDNKCRLTHIRTDRQTDNTYRQTERQTDKPIINQTKKELLNEQKQSAFKVL